MCRCPYGDEAVDIVNRIIYVLSMVNVSALIERSRFGRFQAGVLVLCALVVLLDGADNIVIGLVGKGVAGTMHVPVASLGLVFSAGQFGFMFGALVFGPLGDRSGRRPVLIAAVATFGLTTLLLTVVPSVPLFVIVRFISGVGMGGAAPLAIALVAEYVPRRIRASLVALVWGAFPLGGVVIGLAAAVILPYGWQWLFALIGGLSVAVTVVLVIAIPESVGFLVARGDRADRVARLVRRVAPGTAIPDGATFELSEARLTGVPLKNLFTEGRAVRTLLLWGAFFMSYLPLVFVTNWAPAILQNHGVSPAQTGLAITLNSLGSAVGSGGIGRLMDRFGAYGVVCLALGCAAVSLVALGAGAGAVTAAMVAITAAGMFAGAGQSGVIALGSLLYGTRIRSTALGWAMSVGRIGSATGPLIGGAMIAAAWSPVSIFGTVGVISVIGLAFVLAVRATTVRTPDPPDAPAPDRTG